MGTVIGQYLTGLVLRHLRRPNSNIRGLVNIRETNDCSVLKPRGYYSTWCLHIALNGEIRRLNLSIHKARLDERARSLNGGTLHVGWSLRPHWLCGRTN